MGRYDGAGSQALMSEPLRASECDKTSEAPAERAMADLERAVSQLTGNVADLEGRLSGVMSPESPSVSKEGLGSVPCAIGSQLVSAMRAQVDQLVSLSRRINVILRRIEV